LKPEATSERPPLNLAIVLDRSGSMSGQPLDKAKRCAGMIVARLEARDRAAPVARRVRDFEAAEILGRTRTAARHRDWEEILYDGHDTPHQPRSQECLHERPPTQPLPLRFLCRLEPPAEKENEPA
jgi:hypothetical protein